MTDEAIDPIARAAILYVVVILSLVIAFLIVMADDVERLKRITAPKLIFRQRKPPAPTSEPAVEITPSETLGAS